MKHVTCCGKAVAPCQDTAKLWYYRNEGFTEDDAQELSITCFLCDQCSTVYEEHNGKLFVIHLPTRKEVDLDA